MNRAPLAFLAFGALVSLTAVTACKNSSPLDPLITAASNNPGTTSTRIIGVSGDVEFGTVPVGTTMSRTFTITNTGTGTLTLSGLTAEGGSGSLGYSTDFSASTIAAGASKTVTVAFAPTLGRTYATFVTLVGNQTSGTATFAVTGAGSVDHIPVFSQSGTGNALFAMPAHVALVRVTGHFVGSAADPSNFVVFWGNELAVNAILRTADYDAALPLVGGGSISITNSASIAWTFTEVR